MRGPIHFLVPELSRWDAATADALMLSYFSDERPLRGAAGLADWRLSGRLTKLVRNGRAAGAPGETLLVPPAGGRLSFPRLLLLGLGPSAGFDESMYRTQVGHIRALLAKAGITRYAVQPPGRATGLIAPRRALELWLEESEKDALTPEVTIIESQAGQKEMAKGLRALWKANVVPEDDEGHDDGAPSA